MHVPDRYHLLDRVVDGAGWSGWRGHDSVLHRDVAVVVVSATHPRREETAEAARAASMVSDARFLHVYDVLDVEGAVWVVREWVSATSLVDRLSDGPMLVQDACALGIQVAQALATARGCGVTHAALGPEDVRLTEDGRVKLRGLGTRAVLEGPAEGPPPDAADSWGAAAVTYAGVTGYWPGRDRDGLPGAVGAAPRPRQVRAGVPKVVDTTIADLLARPPTDPAQVAHRLEQVLASVGRRVDDHEPERDERPTSPALRALAVGAGAALVAGLVGGALWVGLSLTRTPAAAGPGPGTSQPVQSLPGTTPTPSLPARIEVVAGTDFDPYGNGSEEPDLVSLAFDDNLATAWHTVSYRQPDLAPKPGVGVVFDLGRVETVGAVRLNLLGAGTSLQVRVSTRPGTRLSDFARFGSATGLGDLVALRSSEPVQARYVLVWLTRLPADGDAYRGGIAEIQVASN